MAPAAPEIEEPVSTTPPGTEVEAASSGETEAGGANEAEIGSDSLSESTLEESGASDSREAETEDADDEEITIVIEDPTGPEESPNSLFAAAKAERARRARTGESTIVITDKNLKEHAARGQLTFVEEAESETEDGEISANEEADDLLEETAADEAYWRERVLRIRQSWREAIDRIEALERRIAALRQDFYAEDDPFYRDSQIKPAWDRALEELEASRRRARLAEEDLALALEEGRRGGALPGWLREGLELEPTVEELEAIGEGSDEDGVHEPSEPVVLDEDRDDDGGSDRRRP